MWYEIFTVTCLDHAYNFLNRNIFFYFYYLEMLPGIHIILFQSFIGTEISEVSYSRARPLYRHTQPAVLLIRFSLFEMKVFNFNTSLATNLNEKFFFHFR